MRVYKIQLEFSPCDEDEAVPIADWFRRKYEAEVIAVFNDGNVVKLIGHITLRGEEDPWSMHRYWRTQFSKNFATRWAPDETWHVELETGLEELTFEDQLHMMNPSLTKKLVGDVIDDIWPDAENCGFNSSLEQRIARTLNRYGFKTPEGHKQ